MDTQWYAVDENGHIAQLDTNEGGAVPKGGGFPEGQGYSSTLPLIDEEDLVGAALELLARREDAVAEVLREFDLTAQDVAKALLFNYSFRSRVDGEWNAMGYLGLFVYRCQSQYSAPYPRVVRPAHPLRLEELPESVRSQFQPGIWPEQFAEQQLIQPVEKTTCRTWGGYWVDRDGRMHVFDGVDYTPNEKVAGWMIDEARSVEVKTADGEQFLEYLASACRSTIDQRERERPT